MYSRSQWAMDPRAADLPYDSVQWSRILAEAYDAFPQPHPLFGALHGSRCLGATLSHEENGWRIDPPSDPEDAQGYRAARSILLQHASRIKHMLARLR